MVVTMTFVGSANEVVFSPWETRGLINAKVLDDLSDIHCRMADTERGLNTYSGSHLEIRVLWWRFNMFVRLRHLNNKKSANRDGENSRNHFPSDSILYADWLDTMQW